MQKQTLSDVQDNRHQCTDSNIIQQPCHKNSFLQS